MGYVGGSVAVITRRRWLWVDTCQWYHVYRRLFFRFVVAYVGQIPAHWNGEGAKPTPSLMRLSSVYLRPTQVQTRPV